MSLKFTRMISAMTNPSLYKAKGKNIKIPEGIYFGCFGNPIKSDTPICNCCSTHNLHLENYKKYLYHCDNYEKLKLKKVPCNIEGFYHFI